MDNLLRDIENDIVIMIWKIRIVRHAEVDYIRSVLTKNWNW